MINIKRNVIPDVLFMKNLYTVVKREEVEDVIRILDKEEDFNLKDREKVELFFLKASNRFGSYYDTLLLLCDNFDFDIQTIVDRTSIIDKIRAEKRSHLASISEFFE